MDRLFNIFLMTTGYMEVFLLQLVDMFDPLLKVWLIAYVKAIVIVIRQVEVHVSLQVVVNLLG